LDNFIRLPFNKSVLIFRIIGNSFSPFLRRIFENKGIGRIERRLNVHVASLNECCSAFLLLQTRNFIGFTLFCSNRCPNGSGSTLANFCKDLFNLKFPKESALLEFGK
jgi:hypothetical protein